MWVDHGEPDTGPSQLSVSNPSSTLSCDMTLRVLFVFDGVGVVVVGVVGGQMMCVGGEE